MIFFDRFRRLGTLATITLGIFLCAPGISFAADLSFSPGSISFPVDQTFSAKVIVDPGSDSINAADGTITFDPTALSVASISKDGSVFSLWTSDPTFSNSAGTITFSGGSPSGISSKGTVITITFKAKKKGASTLAITKASVLAADGKGTNVFKNGGIGSVTITDAAPAPDATATDASASNAADSGQPNGPTPLAPVVTAPMEPKEDGWYSTTTAEFYWEVPADATGVRALLSQADNETPNKLKALSATASSSVYTGLKDGVSYFYAQFKNDNGWGDPTKRKVQIDTTPPQKFTVSLKADGADAAQPKLAFSAKDDLSGIDRYEIIFGSSVVATIHDSDLTNGAYPIPPQDGGPTKVSIKAYDKAANITEAQADLTLPKVAKPAAKSDTPAEVPQTSNPWPEHLLVIAFAIVIGVLTTWNYMLRKALNKSRSNLLTRINEFADKNDKVFSAMREEFEQLVNGFDPRPQLTPEERDLLENIKEVLDISEEVIDTEIDELKKNIREL